MWQALLAIQNNLENSITFNRSRETVVSMPFGDKTVTQFSGFSPTSVSYLNSPPPLPLPLHLDWVKYKQSKNVSEIPCVLVARWVTNE